MYDPPHEPDPLRSADALAPSVIEPLLTLLSDPDPQIREPALHALLQLPLTSDSLTVVGAYVVRMLNDADKLSSQLLISIANIPLSVVQDRLRQLLRTEDDDLRQTVALALARAGDPVGSAQLKADLAHPDRDTRRQAAGAFCMIDISGARQALRRTGRQDADPEVRLWASLALAKSGERRALERVLTDLQRRNITLPLPWSDPEDFRAYFSGVGPMPQTVVEMLETLTWSNDSEVAALAEALLAETYRHEQLSVGTPRRADLHALPDMTVEEFMDRWGPHGETPIIDFSVEPPVTTGDLDRLVNAVIRNITVGEERSLERSVGVTNDLVRLASRYQSDFEPNVNELFNLFEEIANDPASREQVAWMVSRLDMDRVVSDLSEVLDHPDPPHRRQASKLIDLAATYAHEDSPPVFRERAPDPSHLVGSDVDASVIGYSASAPPTIERVGVHPEALESSDERGDVLPVGASLHRRVLSRNGDLPRLEPLPTVQSTKEIGVWVEERQDEPDRPLVVGELYTLSFKIGSPVGGSLLSGPGTEVAESDIPQSGLVTHWTVTSDNVELRSISPEVEVRARPASGPDHWAAHFQMKVERERDSDTVQLGIVPRDANNAQLSIMIDVRLDAWREFLVELAVAPSFEAAEPGSGPVAAVVDETIFTPADQLNPFSWHEWTTPPGTLALHIRGGSRIDVTGDVYDDGFKYVWEEMSWGGQRANVSNLIRALRSETERFRAAEQNYLNDIDYDDLTQRLPQFERIYDWNNFPDLADAAHREEWERVASSESLRRVATTGYALYQQCFPHQNGKSLRKWLDGLLAGFQLDIRWTSEDPDWVPHMPWGLMYMREPDLPIDPMYFMGMRFRISYVKRRFSAPRHLGSPDAAFRAHNVYWGTGDDDPVAVEAGRQAAAWSALAPGVQIRGIPAPADPRGDFLTFMADPQPPPMTLLYFFCQCTFNNNGLPELWFGRNENQQDKIDILMDASGNAFQDRPLVFANACGTASASTYEVNELERYFFSRDARAFLGTEALVPIQFASRFASIFFYFFYRLADPDPIAAGEAVTQTRLFLWSQYRNIGGLLYSYVDQFNLYMADHDEIRHN